MLPVSEEYARASFVNATRKELTETTFPADFSDTRWDRLDYLGWRDRRIPRRAYLLVPVDGTVRGVVLKQAEAAPRSRAQCSWCQDIHLPNDVLLYSARRAGAGGRVGNSIGTLVCANFECSVNVRRLPPIAYVGFDVEAAKEERIAVLQSRAASFALAVMLDN